MTSQQDVMSEEGGGCPLSLDDCRCPVCLEIYMEPVTLPCTHTFCKVCFLETVDKSTLCCPMCRKRVSSWARRNSRNHSLVDQNLWRRIQVQFPRQCERRRSGLDHEDEPGVSVCVPSVSLPGELRQEYEDEVMKVSEERRVREEEEQKESKAFIQMLLAKDEAELEAELEEERRRREEDERLARVISEQLNSPVAQQSDVALATDRKKEVGLIERFFSPISSKTLSNCGSASKCNNKENVVVTGDGQSASTKRSNDEPENGDQGASNHEPGLPPFSGRAPSARLMEAESNLLNLQQRQEEEDRVFALTLQRELDHLDKVKSTDRRKGSADAYSLRDSTRAKMEADVATPRTKKRRHSPSCPSPSSSSSSSRRQKQTTLTDMFPLSS